MQVTNQIIKPLLRGIYLILSICKSKIDYNKKLYSFSEWHDMNLGKSPKEVNKHVKCSLGCTNKIRTLRTKTHSNCALP